VAEPHGPIRISANRQIALPKALTTLVALDPGDFVYLMQCDSDPASLLVVPAARLAEWVQAGRHIDGQSGTGGQRDGQQGGRSTEASQAEEGDRS
jgi:hypothetical protein